MEDNIQVQQDQNSRLRLGQIAQDGLGSEFWTEIVGPILDSMIKGLVDIREIKKTLLTSNKKAEIMVEGRATAAEYLSEVETLIRGYIDDAETTKRAIDNRGKSTPLYKEL